MLNKLSVTTINLYQKYISPHKGYCCAHRAYTGEYSCSQYTKIAIEENGLFFAFLSSKNNLTNVALLLRK